MTLTVTIKHVGDSWYELYVNGNYEQDACGIEVLHRVIDKIFNPKQGECLNIPVEMLTPCDVGKITSDWNREHGYR